MSTPGIPPIPHVGGPLLAPGVPSVVINGQPAAVATGMAFCAASPPDVISKGSMTVKIAGMPAARVGDTTAHGGAIVMGSPNVFIGDGAGGGGGAAGVSSAQAGLLAAAEAAMELIWEAQKRLNQRILDKVKAEEQKVLDAAKHLEKEVASGVKKTAHDVQKAADAAKDAGRQLGQGLKSVADSIPEEGKEKGMK